MYRNAYTLRRLPLLLKEAKLANIGQGLGVTKMKRM